MITNSLSSGVAVSILFLALTSWGCQSPTSSSSTITGLTLSNTGYNLEVGGSTGQLTATVAPASASQTVTWSTSNSGITSVTSTGLITAVSAGTAMITATASDGKTVGTCGTAVWQNDGNGYLRYLSADTAFYGWSFFHSPPGQSSLLLNPHSVSVTVAKVSGNVSQGYGIVFCVQDSNDYYRFLISSDGWYQLSKFVGGVQTMLVPWTPSSYVTQGQGTGVANILGVTQPSAGNISITINGNAITTVGDSSFTGGKVGFWASDASTGESFPGTPEDVRFKATSPITYP